MLRHATGFNLANADQDSRYSTVPRAQEHQTYGAVHRIGGRPVQRFLGRINDHNQVRQGAKRSPEAGQKAMKNNNSRKPDSTLVGPLLLPQWSNLLVLQRP
jgi:hypothetical protein